MATVIKSDEFTLRGQGGLRPFNLNDIEAEGRRLVAAAKQQADQMLADARARAARLEAQARQHGHQEGMVQGLEAGRRQGRDEAFQKASEQFASQQTELICLCQNAITEFDQNKKRLLLSARVDAIELAIAIARRVVKHVSGDPAVAAAAVVANAGEALELVGRRTDVMLRVNPADLAAMETFAKAAAEAAHAAGHVDVVVDASITRGGCVLTTPEGQVDATLETQLDQIAAMLVGAEKPAETTVANATTGDRTDTER
ncbi:MAG: hypothetical protein JXA69_06265 [Phycisphaerae bacterium]|nr:hypothetical protein [Phycisphaerae bacterium]